MQEFVYFRLKIVAFHESYVQILELSLILGKKGAFRIGGLLIRNAEH